MAHVARTCSLKGSKCGKLLVGAIELGTTYSEYGFSFRSEYADDHLEVHFPSKWVGGPGFLKSLKTPTVLLLNPDLTFNSFGYEAENEYMKLTEDNAHHDHHYFRCFTMMLHDSMNMALAMMTVEDSNKRKVKALTVFASVIKYLKSHLIEYLSNRLKGVGDDDIYWILTVPAKWSLVLKQFMRQAAEMAEIKHENLDIVLEPEAASLYCMHLPVDKMNIHGQLTESLRSSPFAKGTKYMLVDVGGETVQISMYEVLDTGKLLELGHANDLQCGGKNVDAGFDKFFKDIVGPDIFEIFQRGSPTDYIDLHREFETKKHRMITTKTGKESIKIPYRLYEVYEEEMGKRGQKKTFSDRLKEIHELEGKVVCKGDKLRVDAAIVRSWFEEPCKRIVRHVRESFKYKKSEGINTILLVGGFSQSQMLQNEFISTFNDRIIIPEQSDLVVLKGAVLYGHNPIISKRRRNLFSWK